MTDFFAVHVRPDGTHEVYITPDGISRIPVPRAAFGNPRDAIRYAEMRQLAVSPLRSLDDDDSHQSRTPSSGESSGEPAGRVWALGDPDDDLPGVG